MRMQVIRDSSFARPGSAPIWGGKKGEFRDWTRNWVNLSLPQRFASLFVIEIRCVRCVQAEHQVIHCNFLVMPSMT